MSFRETTALSDISEGISNHYSVQFIYFAKVKYITLKRIQDGELVREPRKNQEACRAERKIPSVQQRLHDSDRMKILFCWFILTHKCPFFFHVGFTISFLHFSVVNFIKQQGSCSLIYLFLI